MISKVISRCHFEQSEKSAFDMPITAGSSAHLLLRMTRLVDRNFSEKLPGVFRQSAFVILALLLLIVASNCALSAQSQPQKSNSAVVRHELKQILSQSEYNRVYSESKPPKWWNDFWRKAGRIAEKAVLWFLKSLSLQGEKAGRVASFVFACLVIIAFLALLVLIARRLSGRIKPTSILNEEIDQYELPSARPLISEAAKLADSGDWRGAFRCVYLASISHLDEIGALRFEKSRTNWEYLRELDRAGRISMRDQLKPLTSDFDRKFYGQEICDKEDYDRALAVYQSIINEAAA